jgi:hypothetical protein
VKDGVIHVAPKPSPVGYLRTTDKYTSYVLKLEYRHLKKGNGGVLVRVLEPDKVWPKSMECQGGAGDVGDIWNIDKFPATVAPERTEGRRTKKLHDSNEKPFGEWNHYEISVDGTNLTLKVNGLVQNTAADVEIVPGYIALQSEGGEMEFRNLVLTPLPDKGTGGSPGSSAAATLAAASTASSAPTTPMTLKDVKIQTGAGPAVTAKDDRPSPLPGWHVTGTGTWTLAEDGTLISKHSPDMADYKHYGHLVTDAAYRDFKISVKFKAVKGNAGIYFRIGPNFANDMAAYGMQAEIDAAKDVGYVYESGGQGWIIKPDAARIESYFKKGEWNEMTVEGKGDHFKVTVNGQTSVEFDNPRWPQGPLALQMHGGADDEVHYKDIKIEGEPVKAE